MHVIHVKEEDACNNYICDGGDARNACYEKMLPRSLKNLIRCTAMRIYDDQVIHE